MLIKYARDKDGEVLVLHRSESEALPMLSGYSFIVIDEFPTALAVALRQGGAHVAGRRQTSGAVASGRLLSAAQHLRGTTQETAATGRWFER